MKRVLIITYYWPPSGGGGVQRWLKFAKYLPQNNWQPIIFTPENADYPILDDTLSSEIPKEAEIIRIPIWEPYRYLRSITSKQDDTIAAGFIRKEKKESFKSKLIGWVRGNLIIPDARRFWIRPSVRYLIDYLEKNPVDIIVSTGPPHSMHLIANRVSKKVNIPWLADFRDPWVNMDNADKFRMSKVTKYRHRSLERNVLKTADRVTTVSWHLSSQYEKIRGRKTDVLTNGFDHVDFENLQKNLSDSFTIGHYGTFGSDRNPQLFWEALSEICKENAKFKKALRIELVGPTDIDVMDSAIENELKGALQHMDYLKHNEVLVHMKNADLLLVILNQNGNEEGRVTGKIFEYIATGNGVLGLGSTTSDCARVINEVGAGEMIPFNNKEKMKSFLLDAFERKMSMSQTVQNSAMRFSRAELTTALVSILNEMAK